MKKNYNFIFFVVNLISIIFGFLNLNNISNEIVLLPLLIIICFTICLILKKNFINKLDFNIKKIIFLIILCIIFLLMLPINSIWNSLVFFDNIFILNFICKLIFLCSLLSSLFYIFNLILSYECKEIECTSKMKRIIFIINFLICLFFISSTNTGFFDWDFSGIWQQDQSGWSNWHTFSFSFLVYIGKNIFNNTYFIILINFILYIKFISYSVDILCRKVKNEKIVILFFLINIFTLVGFDQLRYLKKDVIFALGFCNLLLTIFDYLLSNKLTKKIVINFILFSTITLLFRHGSLYLIIFIYLILGIYVLINKKYKEIKYFVIIIFSISCFNFIVNYIGYKVMHGYDYPSTVKYTVPIYQVGAFANNGYKFTGGQRDYIETYLPIEYMADNFVKYNGDILTRSWHIPDELKVDDDFDCSKFIDINYALFTHKPIFYVRSLLDLTNILWKIVPNNDELNFFFYFVKWDKNSDIVEFKETFTNKYVDFIIDNGLKKFLYGVRVRGAFPLFMIILSSLIIIYKKKYKYLIPVACILFWYACLFLSLPLCVTRYCLPFINIYPFILCFCLGLKNKIK